MMKKERKPSIILMLIVSFFKNKSFQENKVETTMEYNFYKIVFFSTCSTISMNKYMSGPCYRYSSDRVIVFALL